SSLDSLTNGGTLSSESESLSDGLWSDELFSSVLVLVLVLVPFGVLFSSKGNGIWKKLSWSIFRRAGISMLFCGLLSSVLVDLSSVLVDLSSVLVDLLSPVWLDLL